MRHRKTGRQLSRNSSHRKATLQSYQMHCFVMKLSRQL